MSYIKQAKNGVYIFIHAQPGAKNTRTQGLYGERLKIRIQSQPQNGKANIELIGFLSEVLGIAKKYIQITNGESSQQKTVFIQTELSVDFLKATLGL